MMNKPIPTCKYPDPCTCETCAGIEQLRKQNVSHNM